MLKAKLLGTAAGSVLRVWRLTVRVEMRGLHVLERFPRAPIALWHGRIQGSVYGVTPHGRFAAMFSRSADGEFAARSLATFGLGAARGSSGKGGRGALDELLDWTERGVIDHPALTVDGPRGPWRRVKPGIVELARRLEAPVLPVSFSASRFWILRSWDRMVLARPFSRVVAAFGTPVPIPRTEPVDVAARRIAEALDRLTRELDVELHGRALWPPAAP